MKIYLDHAATTPVRSEVLEAMKPYFSERFGNASSLHKWGQEAKEALEQSRSKIASVINSKPEEIIFTSGGTESNNLALKGLAFANPNKKHIITSAIEHHCVLNTCEWLEKQGYSVTYLPVDKYGLIKPEDVEQAIRADTLFVSIMHANNEIGTVQPIAEIGKICRSKGVLFHTDAVQSFGKVPINVEKMNIDLLSASSHKLYGPKGVGCLYVRSRIKIEPLAHGGGHEFGKRSGTENVAGIVGFGKASELAQKEMNKESIRLKKLRDYLIHGILQISDSYLNGHPSQRMPNNTNFWFKFVEGESIVLHLDAKGVAASTGSACSSKSLEPSHVLLAIGLKHEEAHGSLRLTLGKATDKKQIDYVLKELPHVIEKLRKISPFKKSYG